MCAAFEASDVGKSRPVEVAVASPSGAAIAGLLFDQAKWQLRKVESRRFMEGGYHVTRVSIDCVPPDLEQLRYKPAYFSASHPTSSRGTSGGGTELVMVPITFMRKGALRSFDMRGPNGEALSVVGRAEYTDVMVEALLYELRDAVRAEHVVGLRDVLGRIVDGDIEQAGTLALELANEGCAEEVQYLERSGLNDYATELLVRLAEGYVLIALLPSDYAGSRVVLKYSHNAVTQQDNHNVLQRLRGAAGWEALTVAFDLSHPAGSASHHLEVHVPTELDCSGLTMPPNEDGVVDRNTQDLQVDVVAHAVASYQSDPGEPALLDLRVPWSGLRSTTFWVSATTFVILMLGQFLSGAQAALIEANDGAAALLLALPAVAVALTAGRGENELVSWLLGPLRLVVVGCAFLLLACAGSIVGVLHQPFRATLWCVGSGVSGVVALGLVRVELRSWRKRTWLKICRAVGGLCQTLVSRVRQGGARDDTQQ